MFRCEIVFARPSRAEFATPISNLCDRCSVKILYGNRCAKLATSIYDLWTTANTGLVNHIDRIAHLLDIDHVVVIDRINRINPLCKFTNVGAGPNSPSSPAGTIITNVGARPNSLRPTPAA